MPNPVTTVEHALSSETVIVYRSARGRLVSVPKRKPIRLGNGDLVPSFGRRPGADVEPRNAA